MAGAAAIVAATGFRVFRNVPTGHMGVMTRFARGEYSKDKPEVWIGAPGMARLVRSAHDKGELYGIVPPGSYRVLPFIHNIVTVCCTDNTTELGGFPYTAGDEEQLHTSANMTWHVRPDDINPYRAHFSVASPAELAQTVRGIVINALGSSLGEMTRKESLKTADVNDAVQGYCRDDLLEYGVALKRVTMTPPTQTMPEMYRQGLRDHANILITGSDLELPGGSVLPIPAQMTNSADLHLA